MMPRTLALAGALLMIAALLPAGLPGPVEEAAATHNASVGPCQGEPSATNHVNMEDNFFTPAIISIELGEAVQWTNNGNNVHTTTENSFGPEDPVLWNSGQMQRAATYTVMFCQPGTFNYHCLEHGFGMSGSVVVG